MSWRYLLPLVAALALASWFVFGWIGAIPFVVAFALNVAAIELRNQRERKPPSV